ncbi:energy transducer TonB [Pseudoxanthomonas sp. NC8]|nr:energy transducer TonB [Pseudoxanthomonas sp. NC8]
MATYPNHHHDTAPVEPAGPAAEPKEPQRTSPMLVAALALALVTLGVWSYTRYQDSAPATTAPVATAPASTPVIAPATPDGQPARAVRRDGTREVQRRPAVAVYRAPRPLAGNPLPEYPRAALRGGEEGSVLLHIAVDANGTPTDVQVIQRSGSRDRDLDRAAIEAARKWRFTPAMRDGKAVPSAVQLPVDFRRG